MVDIFISRVRGKSNPGLVNHISAYNNKLPCHEISIEDIATIFAVPKVGSWGGIWNNYIGVDRLFYASKYL